MVLSYVEWLRSKVGTRKVFLPFTSVVAQNAKGQILLQRRTDFDFWGLPGGVVELDEDLHTSARRELREETGLTIGALRLVGVYSDPRYDVTYPNGDQVQQCTFCFAGQISGGDMTPDGVETSDQRFLGVEELSHYPMPVWYKDMIGDALKVKAPTFHAPFSGAQVVDQIEAVRPFLGSARYSGIGASALITRDDGRILMLQHVGERAWRHPAGFAHLGENVAFTAVRELQEETGLQIVPEGIAAVHATPRLNVTYANGDQIRNVGTVFRARVVRGELSLDHKEIAAAQWMRPDEVPYHVSSSRRWFYEKLLAHLDRGYLVC